MKSVADAIILERAAAVLERRYPGGLRYDVAWLAHYAGELRREAEAEPTPVPMSVTRCSAAEAENDVGR